MEEINMELKRIVGHDIAEVFKLKAPPCSVQSNVYVGGVFVGTTPASSVKLSPMKSEPSQHYEYCTTEEITIPIIAHVFGVPKFWRQLRRGKFSRKVKKQMRKIM